MTNFYEIGLTEELISHISSKGYQNPTLIQARAIPRVLAGRDIFASAQTGTGKTASFLLPLIEILRTSQRKSRMPRVIILEPTRELAAQVIANFEALCSYPLKAALVVGGDFMSDQEKKLRQDIDVVVATPGRLLDLCERGSLLLAGINCLVIDEADRMMDMGFMPDVERIIQLTPKTRQTLLFSATFSDEIKAIAQKHLTDPHEITVSPETMTAETIQQFLIECKEEDKRKILRQIIRHYHDKTGVIFCNRKKDIRVLTSSLQRHGIESIALHGDMQQSARNEALEKFRTKEVSILVASDVAARGLDISGVGFVVNFDIPSTPEDYVHRIGRTGRAGQEGVAVCLISKRERKYWSAVLKLINVSPQKWPFFEEKSLEQGDAISRRIDKRQTKGIKLPERSRKSQNPDSNVEPAEHSQIMGFGDWIPAFIKEDLVGKWFRKQV